MHSTVLKRIALLVTLCSVVAAGCGSPSPAPKAVKQSTARPDVETAGKELFEADCAACHGTNLKGGLKIGSATSADIRWSTLKTAYTVPLLRRAILTGFDEKGQPLDSAMPRWQGKLSGKQVDQLIAYLKTK